MAEALDLLKIAQEEQDGDLFKYLDGIYKRSKVQPTGISDAVIWEGGNAAGGVKPVAHAFTDMFALNGTIMALDVLGLPFLAVPMMGIPTQSCALFQSLITSAVAVVIPDVPRKKSKRSDPEFPQRLSLPVPPSSKSSPEPPLRLSLPASP